MKKAGTRIHMPSAAWQKYTLNPAEPENFSSGNFVCGHFASTGIRRLTTYDPIFNKLTTVTDPRGLVTTMAYEQKLPRNTGISV